MAEAPRLLRLLPPSLMRYGVVGLATNGGLYLLFVLLVWLGLSAVATAALCYGLGLALSYLLNRRWSFQSTASHRRDLPRFLLSYGVGFIATMIFIALLTRVLRPEIAQFLNIGLTAMVIYLCLRLTRFGHTEGTHAD
ncbi:GtrA family protein [Enterovirga sp.]|uniref:GtrA family protein n=1 Tax=Enterovirga sp. TaxID=2026350 RepID=UPI002B8C971E|nr:GtrA family protein [Enterovirga sp.]HMO29827.1 GtrA family protein [Enterovirga sp.]